MRFVARFLFTPILALAFTLGLAEAGELRTLTNAEGKQVEAELLEIGAETLKIRANNRV